MRLINLQLVASALATAMLSLPAGAASAQHYRHHASGLHSTQEAGGLVSGSGGYGTGPFWQGEPTDNLPIWRYGYYQGTDPDPFIRSQLMRDPTNR
jgi:hypothetical protein